VSEQPPSGLVLAVEAGSTKTDVALVEVTGRLLALTRGGGIASYETPATWLHRLRPLVEQVWRAADARWPRLGGDGRCALVSACVAHLDTPKDEQRFAEHVRAADWADAVLARNDTFAVLRSGTSTDGGGPAIAVVCGSGINCVGVGADGQQVRFLAFGGISGDWGGGNDLGAAALWSATRAEDGRGEPTLLRDALLRHFGAGSTREVALWRRDGVIRDAEIRHCTPVLFAVAAQGDPVAMAIVRRQAEEICAMARVALERLGVLESGAAVVLGGSVLAARSSVLLDSVVAGLAAISPAITVEVVHLPPLTGAALLGLDALGATPAAKAALRGAVAVAMRDLASTPPARPTTTGCSAGRWYPSG
jgi:N-acetylglucosamine kinase-like BadF-type ATPase